MLFFCNWSECGPISFKTLVCPYILYNCKCSCVPSDDIGLEALGLASLGLEALGLPALVVFVGDAKATADLAEVELCV